MLLNQGPIFKMPYISIGDSTMLAQRELVLDTVARGDPRRTQSLLTLKVLFNVRTQARGFGVTPNLGPGEDIMT